MQYRDFSDLCIKDNNGSEKIIEEWRPALPDENESNVESVEDLE